MTLCINERDITSALLVAMLLLLVSSLSDGVMKFNYYSCIPIESNWNYLQNNNNYNYYTMADQRSICVIRVIKIQPQLVL